MGLTIQELDLRLELLTIELAELARIIEAIDSRAQELTDV